MPRFAYKAVDREGKECSGLIEAPHEADALHEIGSAGLIVIDIHQAGLADKLLQRWREHKEQAQPEEDKHAEDNRTRHHRQIFCVRYSDGHTEYGVCYNLNPRNDSFYLDRVDMQGRVTSESKQVHFKDLKAILHVKSVDGEFDRTQSYVQAENLGREVVVEFNDGDVLHGYLLHQSDPNAARFAVFLKDQSTNTVSALVEKTAISGVYSTEEYARMVARRKEERASALRGSDLSQEETMGDFFFETRNYEAALEQYDMAKHKHPLCGRVQRKLLATHYNIGVQHIKRHDYVRALGIMESILQIDPANAHARKKAHQLRKVIHRTEE